MVVTISVWSSGRMRHADRAPGSNMTNADVARAGAGGVFNGPIRTLPVNLSGDPIADVEGGRGAD